MADLLAPLNPSQRRAVQATDGPVLVIAGAGTGKTRTLVHRLAYLATVRDIPAEKLLAVTFTTKAAEEMRERIGGLCRDGLDLSSLWVGTLHGLCYEMVQKGAHLLGLNDDFDIVCPADRSAIIKRAAKTHVPEYKAGSLKQYDLHITLEKNTRASYDDMSSFCRAYQDCLAHEGLLDFDDLILKALELCRVSPETQEKISSRFTHICVDEYQDINAVQYRLIQTLCGPHTDLCVVGDADQAIYAFRGARIENFLNFQKDFPRATVIHLDRNYRSTETILAGAHNVIIKNTQRIERRLIPTRPPGEKIIICETGDEHDEADFIAGEIERLLGGTRFETMSGDAREEVKGFGDVAILYRLHQQCRPLKKALDQRGIPTQVAATRLLFEEPEVKPVVDFLEAVARPARDGALAELLKSPFFFRGSKSIETIIAAAEHTAGSLFSLLLKDELSSKVPRTVRDRLRSLIDCMQRVQDRCATVSLDGIIREVVSYIHPGEKNQQGNLADLATAALPYSHVAAAEGLPRFLQHIALLKEGEICIPRAEAVTLMTLHGAKGLEFPAVFIAGCEDGLFPFRHDRDLSDRDGEEERRLFYVGMTRAQEMLYLVYARERFIFGERRKRPPSSFLQDIPEHTAVRRIKKPSGKKNKNGPKQMKLFAI